MEIRGWLASTSPLPPRGTALQKHGFPLKLETCLKCALPTAVTALLFSPAFSKHRACDQGVLDHDFHTFHDVSECALAFAFAFVIRFDAE